MPKKALNRRDILKVALVGGAAQIISVPGLAIGKKGRGKQSEATRVPEKDTGNEHVQASEPRPSLFGHIPFSKPVFVPAVAQAKPRGTLYPPPGDYPGHRFGDPGGPSTPKGNFDDVSHGIAPEFVKGNVPGFPCDDWNAANEGKPEEERHTHEKEYKLITEETTHEFFPGVKTPVFVYRDFYAKDKSLPGRTPGPTFVSRFREPAVLRNENHLTADQVTAEHDIETSIHLHGSHSPAHADGYPEFYVLAGEARDYFYPNISPRETNETTGVAPRCEGDFDRTWNHSSVWYHDHAMDITGFNVSRGLAGFYLMFDEEELELIKHKVLPPPGREALKSLRVPEEEINDLLGGSEPLHDEGFDFGLALQDQRFNADGTLTYDFLDHNGRLGDVFTVNGTVQPFMNVKRGKYRFRFLNASNARVYQLRLSTRHPFLIFGADSWLFPYAGNVDTFEISGGQRHDVIIDFSHYPAGTEVYLENIMIQTDGRKGKEVDPDKPTPLMQFRVMEESTPFDWSVTKGTTIRKDWRPTILTGKEPKREFLANRGGGAFTINNIYFNPRRTDAVPVLGTTEEWTFINKAGGWWHPAHIHLEGFQIKSVNGKPPLFERSFNCDLATLHGGDEAVLAIKLRTFTGPFVIHCHTIEHEDMRMMAVHDPQPNGISPLDGVSKIDPRVSGVLPTCEELEEEKRIYFDEVGDLERLDGRGVGFPECEFDLDRRGNG